MGDTMKALITLTPAESKKLIARAVLSLPEFQKARQRRNDRDPPLQQYLLPLRSTHRPKARRDLGPGGHHPARNVPISRVAGALHPSWGLKPPPAPDPRHLISQESPFTERHASHRDSGSEITKDDILYQRVQCHQSCRKYDKSSSETLKAPGGR